MRGTCSCCDGEGVVVCPECGGDGYYEQPVERMIVSDYHKNYDKLMELKGDAKRVIKQTEELCKMKPEKEDKYRAQCSEVLKKIDRTATKLYRDGN